MTDLYRVIIRLAQHDAQWNFTHYSEPGEIVDLAETSTAGIDILLMKGVIELLPPAVATAIQAKKSKPAGKSAPELPSENAEAAHKETNS